MRDETEPMKAIIQDGYGRPSRVLHVRDVSAPVVADDAVLVRVDHASLNAKDWHLVAGRPIMARAAIGLLRPKQTVVGDDFAGVVEAVGPGAEGSAMAAGSAVAGDPAVAAGPAGAAALRPGDAVFGWWPGSLAEFVAPRASMVVAKPASLSFAEAAALPLAGVTALTAIRDLGVLRPGESVLVLGAGGGVGSLAVQIARADGGRVTAETSPRSIEVVRGLGPDRVVDRSREDVLRGGERFDLVIDAGGFASSRQLARLLSASGRAMIVGAGDGTSAGMALGMLGARVRSRLDGRPIRNFIAKVTRGHLEALAELVLAGELRPVIGATAPLAEAPAVLDALMDGRVAGKAVIRVGATPG